MPAAREAALPANRLPAGERETLSPLRTTARKSETQITRVATAEQEPVGDPPGIDVVIHQVVQGVNGRIAGDCGDHAQCGDSRRRERPQPEQGSQGGRGHVQQSVGRAGKGKKQLELRET